MSAVFEFVVVVIAAWFVWRIMTRAMRPSQPAEPEPGDYAGSPARLRPRPKLDSGAVAVAEPEDDEALSFPPRSIGNRDGLK